MERDANGKQTKLLVKMTLFFILTPNILPNQTFSRCINLYDYALIKQCIGLYT